jgi:hypothetical protein
VCRQSGLTDRGPPTNAISTGSVVGRQEGVTRGDHASELLGARSVVEMVCEVLDQYIRTRALNGGDPTVHDDGMRMTYTLGSVRMNDGGAGQ